MCFLMIKYLLPFPSEDFASQRCECGGNIENNFSYTVHGVILILYISYYENRIKDLVFKPKL